MPAPIKPTKHNAVAQSRTTAITTTSYTVRQKDTLFHIARKHNTSVANILELNKALNPSKLRIGQSIKIASNKPAQASPKLALTAKKATSKTIPKVAKKALSEAPAATASKAEPTKPKQAQPVDYTPQQLKVRTVAVNRPITFGEFATNNGATVEQLNAINNQRLSRSTVLAAGSELYIPNSQH